jgi:hypothetical protein
MTIHGDVARRLALVGLALFGLVASLDGCARPGSRPGGDKPTPGTYRAGDVALRVEYTGGFVPVETVLTRLPVVSVYGDGRVITEGPVVAIDPGPALPNVLVQTIGTADVGNLATLALSAGVGSGEDLGLPPVADAPSTRFTVLTDAGPRVTEVYALGITDGGSGLTAAQRAARQALQKLVEDLTDLSATLGPDAVSAAQPYRPEAVAVVSRPWTDPGSPDLSDQPDKAWPGPVLPGAPAGPQGLSCVTITGTDAAAVLEAAKSANVLTPWVSNESRWQVNFRPLLPDETSCADLT